MSHNPQNPVFVSVGQLDFPAGGGLHIGQSAYSIGGAGDGYAPAYKHIEINCDHLPSFARAVQAGVERLEDKIATLKDMIDDPLSIPEPFNIGDVQSSITNVGRDLQSAKTLLAMIQPEQA